MRLSFSSSALLATVLLSVPQLSVALEASLAGVVDWHQPKIGIPLLHRPETAPSFVSFPSTSADSSTAVVTITESNVLASLDSSTGNINWRHHLRVGETAQSYHSNPLAGSLALVSSTSTGAVIRLVDSVTGHFIWETAVPVAGSIVDGSTDVAFDGQDAVYVLAGGSTIAKLDAKNGASLWTWNSDSDTVLTRLALPPAADRLVVVGSEKTFTGFRLTTTSLSSSDGSVSSPASSAGSLQSPTAYLVAASTAVWLDGTTIWSLDLSQTGVAPARRSGSFVAIQNLGLDRGGLFLGLKADGSAEVLSTDQGRGTTPTCNFISAATPGESSRTYSSFVDAVDSVFISQAYSGQSDGTKMAFVHVCSVDEGKQSGYTLPYDPASRGAILHSAVHVVPTSDGRDVIRALLTTSTGSVELYEDDQLVFTREESLSNVKSVVFVDLPEQEVLQQTSRDNETFPDRVLRHSIEARHLPAFVTRFVGRLVRPSSATSKLTTSTPSAEDGLWRDQFGFRKLVVVGTANGKVFGLDSSNGNIVWSRLLAHSASDGGSLDIHGVFVTRPAKTGLRPRVAVIGSSIVDGAENTVAFELDSLSGDILGQAPSLFRGRPSEVIPLIVDEHIGKALAVLDSDSKVHFFPQPASSVESRDFVVARATVVAGKHSLAAFRVSTHGGPSEVWRLPFSDGETVHSVSSTSQDPIASFGRVLGDRSSLYKYLNPHLLAVSTISAATSEGTVYLVDGVRGTIIYQVSHANLDAALGIEVSLLENWLVYRYRVQGVVATAGAPSGHRIVTVELFERGVAADKISSSDLTSYSAEHDLSIISKTFILPSGVKALATTSTKFGITSKEILVADDQNQIHSIPRRLLDPRRPHGKPSAVQQEEMLIPYDPVINVDAKRILSHQYELLGVSTILASPALLESTSLVFAHGLDLFSTRVMPSGTFDILSDSFNKAQLVLTILGLSVGIAVVKPIVDRKRSRAKWH